MLFNYIYSWGSGMNKDITSGDITSLDDMEDTDINNENKNDYSLTQKRDIREMERIIEEGTSMGLRNNMFLCHEGAAKATTMIAGKKYLNFATYDYLGINAHPEIAEVVCKSVAIYGTSAGASRIVGGERPPHRAIELALAKLYDVEDCIVYVSGHATNVSTLGYLCGRGDVIFHDGLAHNSIVQGARLSGAKRISFIHNSPESLELLLEKHRSQYKNAVIVTEGLFSMDGNIPDIPRIIELKKRHNCSLYIDEAHSLGVLGATGRGVREHFNIDPKDVDIWMSTLSKSMCGCGGFIAGSGELIFALKHGSPGFMFSVGMPPLMASACLKALEIMLREPERVAKIQYISKYFLTYAKSKGLDTGAAQGYANVPIIIGGMLEATYLSNLVFDRGVYVMPIAFPAVPEGAARLRFFLSATHSEEDVINAIDIVAEELPKARDYIASFKK